MRSLFFGYPGAPPMLGETMRNAAKAIASLPGVRVKTWEDLRVGGKPLVDQILGAIDEADVAVFEVTHLNESVLFELGYAIARQKVVWPLKDSSDVSREAHWRRLALLDTIGQIRYGNSAEILARFTGERPDLSGISYFEAALAPHIESTGDAASLLYLMSPAQTEAGRALNQVVAAEERKGLPAIRADPAESTVYPLTWFVQHVYDAPAILVHFLPPTRSGFEVHNARCALIAGLALGMHRPVLMLAEAPYTTPIDYRDYLYQYPTAEACKERATYWLSRTLAPAFEHLAESQRQAKALELSTELRSVHLGEYVAENEALALQDYFVETPIFNEVVAGPSRVVVGRKGTGKSATLIQAERALRSDKRVLVAVIKPAGYELSGLIRLLKQYEALDARSYVIESLWKYLLYTEIALALERDYTLRPAGAVPDTPEWNLLAFVASNRSWMQPDFAQRLEGAVINLLAIKPKSNRLGDERQGIAERLHAGPLRSLRDLLAPALRGRARVAVLIDNLDKAWDRTLDIEILSRVILGLLEAMSGFRTELEHATSDWNTTVALSIFLRSDIFETISRLAREPDKLPVRRISWHDSRSLIRVVEERYLASRRSGTPPSDLWTRYFCPDVRGQVTPDYMCAVVLPRPRDLLYFCREAIDRAISARHARVEEPDVLAAEQLYSQFAFEAVLVETDITYQGLDAVLIEFAGLSTSLTRGQLHTALLSAGVTQAERDGVIEQLRAVSFLGVRTGRNSWSFTDDRREKQKADVLARRFAGDADAVEFGVHRAFWAYLQLSTPPGQLSIDGA